MIVFFITWFLSGFIGFLIFATAQFRGEEYHLCYFDCLFLICFLITIGGYFGFVISIIIVLNKTEIFQKFIYKLVNIGVKKDDDKK